MKYFILYTLPFIYLLNIKAENISIWDFSNFNNSNIFVDENKTLNKKEKNKEIRQWVIRLEKQRQDRIKKSKEVFYKNKIKCNCIDCFEKAKAKNKKLRYVDYLHSLHK